MSTIDRRQFIKTSGAAVLAASALHAGVGRAANPTPKKGGRLRIGIVGGSTSDSLDPATWSSVFMQVGLMGGVYNNLTEVASNGKLVPELAESWSVSDDAKVWRFKLREGVTFHNGQPFTAKDVIASINHHRGEDSKSAVKIFTDGIESIKADGTHTVVITLKAGNADFPYLMNDVHLVMMPEKDGKADWQSVIGTGGYQLVSSEPGVKMVLKRQPNYWKPNRAHFDEVEILLIADEAARTNALVTGTVDVINRVDLKTAHILKRNKQVVLEEVTGTQHFTIPMNTTVGPFSDNNVRLALKHAIDREALTKTVLRGHGRVGNDHPIAPANRYFAADLPQRQYNPDKAKFYLKQAGMSQLDINLSAADAAFNGAVDTAVLFKEHASKAGININVVREPNDGYWSNVWMKKPFVMCFWGGRPTEDWMLSTAYAAKAKWNDTYWQNERFNQLLVGARSELNDDKRREMYGEMQRLISDDGGAIIPMFANYVDARSNKLAHSGELSPSWELDGWKLVERWWFA